MAPPVRQSQSCARRAGGVRRRRTAPTVLPSSRHDGALGQQRADDLAHRVGGERPGREVGPDGAAGAWRRRAAAPTASASAAERRGRRRRRGPASTWTSQPSGTRSLGLVRGRRRTTPATWRRRAPGGARPSSCIGGELGEVGEPVDRQHGRRRARGAPGTSRRGAWRRSCWRCGWRRRARRPRHARPPRNSAAGSPPCAGPRRARATSVGVDGDRRGGLARRGAGSPPSDQHTSAGRISVATCPGGPIAAATASAASAADRLRCCRTSGSTSRRCAPPSRCRDSSCASYCLW